MCSNADTDSIAVATTAKGTNTDPIKLMSITTLESPVFSTPQIKVALTAKAKEINAAGGINGRKINIDFCNDKFDPNEAAACARRAVTENYAAVIGGATPNAAVILGVLAPGGVPWFAGAGSSGDVELQNPDSYPIHSGTPAMFLGIGKILVDKGGKNVVVLAADSAASRAQGDAVSKGVRGAGGTPKVILVPIGAADYSASAAAAMDSKPDAIALAAFPADTPKIIQALRQGGFRGELGTTATTLPQQAVDALGSLAEGVRIAYRLTPVANLGNAAVARYTKAMIAEDRGVVLDELGFNAYVGLEVLAAVAKGVPDFNAKSFVAALNNIKTPISTDGAVAPYQTVGASPPNPDYPRVANFATVIAQVRDGRIRQETEFFDPLKK